VPSENVPGGPIDLIIAICEGGRGFAWHDSASCRGADPDLFFPKRGASTRPAKDICLECPVQVKCLDHAVDPGEKFGIWGGTSEKERRKIRKALASKA